MCRIAFQLSGNEVAHDDSSCTSVDDDEVHHFASCVQFHCSFVYLTAQCRICSEQQLLSGLSFGIERTRHLCSTERTVVERAAVIACERHSLCHALVYNGVGHFCQTVDICFACAVIATFDRVIEQAVNRVAIVLVILRSVDTALCSNGVCAARRVLYTEVYHFESHFAKRRCG